jgi:hypothetical protein
MLNQTFFTTNALLFVLQFNAVVSNFPAEPRGNVSLILAGADKFYPASVPLNQYLRDNLFKHVLDPLFAQNWNVDMYVCSQEKHIKRKHMNATYHQLFMSGSSAAQPRRIYLELSDYGSSVYDRKKFDERLIPRNFASTGIGMVALYRVQRCYMAALESKIPYSFFIRARPDTVYFSNVPDLRALDPTKLYSRSRFASGLVSTRSELSLFFYPQFRGHFAKHLVPTAVCRSFCPGEFIKRPAVMCPIMDDMLAIVGGDSLWLEPYFFAHRNTHANSGRISKMYNAPKTYAPFVPEVRTTAAVLTANPNASQTPHLFYEPLRWNFTIFRGDVKDAEHARKYLLKNRDVYNCTTRNYTLMHT